MFTLAGVLFGSETLAHDSSAENDVVEGEWSCKGGSDREELGNVETD